MNISSSSLRYRQYTTSSSTTSNSKASPTTQCQKCLKRGHYSYECKAPAAERPYVARPSRTQQLMNPKLAPKLASDTPNALLKKEGVADGILKGLEEERGRKRSASVSSTGSVSTVSTNLSRSRSRSPPGKRRAEAERAAIDAPALRRDDGVARSRRRSRRRSPSVSSTASSSGFSDSEPEPRRDGARRRSSGGQRRSRSRTPDRSHRRVRRSPSRSRSPVRRRRSDGGDNLRRDRERSPPPRPSIEQGGVRRGPAPKDRSLSPYSRRLRLTQAMGV